MEAVQKIDMCIIELPSGPKVLFGQYCMQYGDCFSFMEWDGMYTSLVKKLPHHHEAQNTRCLSVTSTLQAHLILVYANPWLVV